jgi:hypothetical protein
MGNIMESLWSDDNLPWIRAGKQTWEADRQECLQRAEDAKERATLARIEAARWPESSELRVDYQREAERWSEHAERQVRFADVAAWAVEMNELHLMEKQIGPISICGNIHKEKN